MSISQLDIFGGSTIVQDPDAIARQYLESTKGIGTPTITSLSGGRTSAWMAINYPTDYYVFALVRTNDSGHIPVDKGLIRAVREKCPDFVGSLELSDTLQCVLELEQAIGKEIKWVWGENFEDMREIHLRGFLPNRFTRYCTTKLKYIPIFDWVSSAFPAEVVEMNLGFRADEPNRVYRMIGGQQIKGGWDFSELGKCEDHPRSRRKVEWRIRQAPLYLDGVMKYHVHSDPWIRSKPFPEISNCSHCPFHTPKEHRRQYQSNPQCAPFWIGLEETTGNTFVKDARLRDILEGVATPLLDSIGCSCTD